jgi:hypothetical protein
MNVNFKATPLANLCRYAMGTDAKLYEKFLARYSTEHVNLRGTVKKHRFRALKPFYVQKPEQQ